MQVRMDAKAVLILCLLTAFFTLSATAQNSATPATAAAPQATTGAPNAGSQSAQPATSPASTTAGKPASSPPMPVFKSKTELVLVPVSVKDKSGKHVAGLKQDAFALRQDGRDEKVSVFEEINTGAKPAPHPKLPPGVFTNTIADSSQRRLIIIALDTINTAFADQHYAREHLIKYLSEQVQPDALLCLVTFGRGGVKLVHDFSTDPRLLVAALRKVKGISGLNENTTTDDAGLDALQNGPMFQNEVAMINAFANAQTEIQRNDWRVQVLATLDALNQLSQAFAGVP